MDVLNKKRCCSKLRKNSLENTSARVSFFIKLQASACELRKIFKNNFFAEHLWKTASVINVKRGVFKLEFNRGGHICRLGWRNLITWHWLPKVVARPFPRICALSVVSSSPLETFFSSLVHFFCFYKQQVFVLLYLCTFISNYTLFL